MNDVEQRLGSAAEETRQLARNRPPRELGAKKSRPRSGMLVFAATFAVVVLIFGAVPLLVGDRVPPGDTAPLTTPVDTPVTTTETTTTAEAVVCSATGVPAPGESPSLPEAVAATRSAIIEAAMACDLATLETHAVDGFNTSFGGGGFENLVRWELKGEGQLGTLLQLLDLSYEVDEAGVAAIYVWPAAHVYDSWEDVPADLVEELRHVHTDDEIAQMALFGSYMGWRTGIDQDGNWLFFVAGD